MWTLNGRVIREGRSFIDENGVKHPASWGGYEASYKASIGLTEVTVKAKPNETFYWVTGPDITGSYTSVERALEDVSEVDENGDPLLGADGNQIVTPGLKSIWIAKTKETQGGLLSQTDWAYVRKMDTDIAVPTEIQTYRDEVRLAAGTIEGQIAACADLAAFKALFVAPTDADGNVTGNAPINNWPDAI